MNSTLYSLVNTQEINDFLYIRSETLILSLRSPLSPADFVKTVVTATFLDRERLLSQNISTKKSHICILDHVVVSSRIFIWICCYVLIGGSGSSSVRRV